MTVSTLTDHCGYWMRMVSNAISQDFARKLAAEGVTVAEWVFMRALFDADGTQPSTLAADMGMTRGAISKLADRLEAKGLVVRAKAEGRGQTLKLTPEGLSKVPALARLADVNDAEYFGVLSVEDRTALDRSLKLIAERRGLRLSPLD